MSACARGERTDFALCRTRLASDRTILAWYRTAFGAYALAVGFGALVPSLSKTGGAEADAFVWTGPLFALIGAAVSIDGTRRYLDVTKELGGQDIPTSA